ncbi:MAG: hypothetical protein HKM93_19635 [Desulfobacteraceae bacterium]|nr:hypothetical protein [Desulfobacteraceae bacterium]
MTSLSPLVSLMSTLVFWAMAFARSLGLQIGKNMTLSGVVDGVSVVVSPDRVLLEESAVMVIRVVLQVESGERWFIVVRSHVREGLEAPKVSAELVPVLTGVEDFDRRYLTFAEGPLPFMSWDDGALLRLLAEAGLELIIAQAGAIDAWYGIGVRESGYTKRVTMLSKKALCRLESAGWCKGRIVNMDKYFRSTESFDRTVPKCVSSFMIEFGGLHIFYPHQRLPEETNDVKLLGNENYPKSMSIVDYEPLLNMDAYLIGEASNGFVFLLIAEDGKVYENMDGCLYFLGYSGKDALNSKLTNRPLGKPIKGYKSL